MGKMLLNQICVITIKVDNMEECIEFYTKVLDFEINKKYGENIVSLKHEDLPVILEKKGPHDQGIGSGVVFALESNNIDKDFTRLKNQGVKVLFDEPKPCPPGRYFVFTDPSGNQVEVLEFSK